MDADLEYFSGLINLLDEKQIRDYADEEADEWPRNKKISGDINVDVEDDQNEQQPQNQFKRPKKEFHDNSKGSKYNHDNKPQKKYGGRPQKNAFADKPSRKDFGDRPRKQFNKKK